MTTPDTLQPTVLPPAPTLITPECGARGCGTTGDQYTMIHCRRCAHWFCPDHISAEEAVALVHSHRAPIHGLSYYQGLCVPCQQARRRGAALSH
jgi:hypothetical protein